MISSFANKSCTVHANRAALSFCHSCRGYFCADCLTPGDQYYFCSAEACRLAKAETPLAPPAGPPPLADTDGIGGWLIAPAMGLAGGLLFSALGLWFSASRFFETPELGAFVEMGIAAALLSFTAVVAAFFFYRHRWAPGLYIAFLGVNVVLSGLVVALLSASGQDVPTTASSDLGRRIIASLVWIPYFLVSKRVKATFVRHFLSAPPSP